jgi:hypothetical protein
VLEYQHIIDNVVTPKDMYPRFKYTNLANLRQFYDDFSKAAQTLETYTASDAQQLCACTEAQRNKLKSLCDHRLRLRKPEYSLASKVRCQDVMISFLCSCRNKK